MKSYGITTLLTVIHGKGHLIKSMSQSQFEDILKWMNDNLDVNYTICNPVQEGVDDKANQFYRASQRIWKGKTALNNKGGSPDLDNGFSYILYHPQNSGQKGPKGSDWRVWLDSDSPILREWNYSNEGSLDINKCSKWFENTLKEKKSCMVYLYRQDKINKQLIELMGNIVKNIFKSI